MRTTIHVALALTLLAGVPACTSGGKKAETDEKAKKEAPVDPKTLSIVTEEGFVARHPTKPDEPWPAFAGEDVMLGPVKAYLSLPKDVKAPLPAVIVVHEWWGLNEDIKLWCDRLAADGYAALAVDLFGGQVTKDANVALGLYQGAMRDMQAGREIFTKAQEFLTTDPRVKAVRVATLGFGQGGMWAYRGALMMKNPAAVIDYYGLPLIPPAEVKALKAPVLLFYAGKDPSCPPQAVDMVEKWLKEGGVKHELVRYPKQDHAFANPLTGRYSKRAATDAWKKTQAFLAEYVKAPTDAERKALEADEAAEPAAEPEAPVKKVGAKK